MSQSMKINQKSNIIVEADDSNNKNNTTQEISLSPPYLPDQKIPMEFTLVLDLDETLIHFFEMAQPQRISQANNEDE